MVKLLQFTLHKKQAAIHSSEKPTKFGKTTAENSFWWTFSEFNYPNLIRMKLKLNFRRFWQHVQIINFMKVIKVIYVMLKVNSKYNRLICQTRKRTKNGLEQLERMGSNFFSPLEGWDILVRENVYFYEKWLFCFILKT